MYESVDGKPDQEELEQLAKTLDYSFLEDQIGLADPEKPWLRVPPFGTLEDDSRDRRVRTTNLLHFPSCLSGERKRLPRLEVKVGLFQPNSCYFLRSWKLWTALFRCYEDFRVADWKLDVSICAQGQLLPFLKWQVENNLLRNKDAALKVALFRCHESFRVVESASNVSIYVQGPLLPSLTSQVEKTGIVSYMLPNASITNGNQNCSR